MCHQLRGWCLSWTLPSLQDFYDLTMAYFRNAKADNVVHAEIFFDPQTHTARGVPLSQVIEGIARAQQEAEQSLGISSGLILCFLRDQGPQKAMQTLNEVRASPKALHPDPTCHWPSTQCSLPREPTLGSMYAA